MKKMLNSVCMWGGEGRGGEADLHNGYSWHDGCMKPTKRYGVWGYTGSYMSRTSLTHYEMHAPK